MLNLRTKWHDLIPEYGSLYPEKRQISIQKHVNQGLELVYIAKGEVSWYYENSIIVSKAGTLSFSWPGQYHGSTTSLVPASEMHWITVTLENETRFHTDLGFSMEESLYIIRALQNIQPQIIRVDRQIEFFIGEIKNKLADPDIADPLNQIPLLLKMLLIQISQKQAITIDRDTTASETMAVVAHFLKKLEQECSEPWSLGKMCEACQIGRTRFATIVKELTGESPIKTLNRFRIDRARKLLSQIDLTITEIAFDCGFPSSQYFSAVFMAYQGSSPSEYRERMLTI